MQLDMHTNISDYEHSSVVWDKGEYRQKMFWLMFMFFFGSITYGALMALVPPVMADGGFSSSEINAVLTVNYISLCVCVVYGSWKSDNCQYKMGRRMPYIAATLPFATAAILVIPHALDNKLLMLTAIMVYNLAMNIKYTVWPILVYDISPPDKMGRGAGLQALTIGLGYWVGTNILMKYSDNHLTAVLNICAGVLFFSTIAALVWFREPPYRVKNPEPFSIKPLMRFAFCKSNIVKFCALSTAIAAFYIPFLILTAYLTTQLNWSKADAGKLVSYQSFAMLISYPAGWLADHISPYKIFFVGWLVAALGIGTFFITDSFWPLAVAVFMWIGGRTICSAAVSPLLVNDVGSGKMAITCGTNGLYNNAISFVCSGLSTGILWMDEKSYLATFAVAILIAAVSLPLLIVHRNSLAKIKLQAIEADAVSPGVARNGV